MSNFLFLQTEFPALYEAARVAENYANGDPRVACFYARRALEITLDWLFDHDASLPAPYDALGDNLRELGALRFFPRAVYEKARVIQKVGNQSVHGSLAPDASLARQIVEELFHLLFWVARSYGKKSPADGLSFDVAALPPASGAVVAQSRAQVKALADKLVSQREDYRAKMSASQSEIEALQQELKLAKKLADQTPDQHDYFEAQTRDLLIDLLLREAGWPLSEKRDREYEVSGMPNAGGVGYVDYVLWGDDGLPLAVVEAKRTRKSASVGQQQAKLYADSLEKQFGRRPLIYTTNGYETHLWDDARYPPRRVQGFGKKDELERLIARRKVGELGAIAIDAAIVERPYQTRAIRKFLELVTAKQRAGLFVMATGTGKTRVAIALVDVLMRAGLVQRALFLADRTALVNQTVNAFKAHLPGASPVNLVTQKDDAAGAGVFVSTYPTMMGLIEKRDDLGARVFGVEHFDLVIIDEAHRSVYQKYRAIFEYFDALLLGLTATPRDEVDRDTYSLFGLKAGHPTDAYELTEAVKDGYLVPPRTFDCTTQFLRAGIRYSQLSDEDKAHWESQDWGDEAPPAEVNENALNKWLFNADTADKVLQTLMTRGLRVENGDLLGKTIIFAKNHAHAEFIVERFNANYPHLAGHFCRVIDNTVNYAQSLIDDFGTPEKMPQIAVSVDMLDTGIDVPDIVNLAFFKPVRSRTKFWQMIGRGTRLRPDLFGPNQDKREFLVFDFCDNLAFFEQTPDGREGHAQKSLAQRLFERRVELLGQAQGEENAELRAGLADILHREVAAMNPENFVVRPQLRLVEKWSERGAWDELTSEEREEISAQLSALPSEVATDGPQARGFDDLILRLQLALLNVDKSWVRLQNQVRALAENLLEKTTIPHIKAQEAFLLEIAGDAWWEGATLSMLEEARLKMRDLVQFADFAHRPRVDSDYADAFVGDGGEVEMSALAATQLVMHDKKVRAFIQHRKNHPAIAKLRLNQPLGASDLEALDGLLFEASGFESRAEFESYFGPQKDLGKFVRSLVGLDRGAAKAAFGPFLDESRFNSAQIDFVNQIINYLTEKGAVAAMQLNGEPFTTHPDGLEGIFPAHYDELLKVVKGINANAGPM